MLTVLQAQKNSICIQNEMKTFQVVDYDAIIKWDLEKREFKCSQLKYFEPYQYRGEGNSNIVLALGNELKVVRLTKVRVADKVPEDEWEIEKKRIEREVIFVNHVFAPILGTEFVHPVSIIRITKSKINELNNDLKRYRPLNRMHKELGVPYGTYHTDLARISANSIKPDYCIEIKPKQGWWDTSSSIQPNLCTFCLNQFLKIKQNKIKERSLYCPLDLFSGVPVRMIEAVIGLVNNPQNNFRIFKNGALVYGDNKTESLEPILEEWLSNSSDPQFNFCASTYGANNCDKTSPHYIINRNLLNFIYILCISLLKPFVSKISSKDETFTSLRSELKNLLSTPFPYNGGKKSCMSSSSPLPPSSILSRLLSAQKLGSWPVSCIYNLFPRICPTHSSSINPNSRAKCPGAGCDNGEMWLSELKENPGILSPFETESIEHYLLAATAKDCSLMLTFSSKSNDETESGVEDLGGKFYRVRVGVADLDPKPITSIARHYVRDLGMLEAYRSLDRAN